MYFISNTGVQVSGHCFQGFEKKVNIWIRKFLVSRLSVKVAGGHPQFFSILFCLSVLNSILIAPHWTVLRSEPLHFYEQNQFLLPPPLLSSFNPLFMIWMKFQSIQKLRLRSLNLNGCRSEITHWVVKQKSYQNASQLWSRRISSCLLIHTRATGECCSLVKTRRLICYWVVLNVHPICLLQ